jgi:dTDP-6-deoxy-L-talose 4-dehydrogenase (NAD+)
MREGCLSEDTPAEPATCYGRAKDALRRQLEDLSETAPFDLRWLRLFYLYGDGQPATSLYSQFGAALARGDKTFDMSKGDQMRDFMRVADAAAAIVAAALAANAPRVLNVCSGTPISVRALVENWRTEMAADIALNLGAFARPAYEPFAFWGDNGRLRAVERASSGPVRI